MKRVIYIFIALMNIGAISDTQNYSGTIYLENQETIAFFDMKSILLTIKNYGDVDKPLYVKRGGAIERIPFDRLRSFEVISISPYRNSFDAVVEITYINDRGSKIDIFASYERMDRVEIVILDTLTSERTLRYVKFIESGKIKIRKIVFD